MQIQPILGYFLGYFWVISAIHPLLDLGPPFYISWIHPRFSLLELRLHSSLQHFQDQIEFPAWSKFTFLQLGLPNNNKWFKNIIPHGHVLTPFTVYMTMFVNCASKIRLSRLHGVLCNPPNISCQIYTSIQHQLWQYENSICARNNIGFLQP